MTGTPVQHTPGYAKIFQTGQSVTQLESVLSNWFEAEVVLTSAGRSAILLYLTAAGLNRYKHRVAVPRMISACVLDAVIRRAFPIDVTSRQPVDMTILYHQYGIPQRFRPETPTLEDISHMFFASESTGARSWAGQAAVFSIPKFFQTASMIGGLITPDLALAQLLRAAREEAHANSDLTRVRHAECLQKNTSGPDIEETYLARLNNPRIEDEEIAGAPTSINEIRKIARVRRQHAEQILSSVGTHSDTDEWRILLEPGLSFACPIFGDPAQLGQANAELGRIGVVAGLYQIDCARDMTSPHYKTALLLPCHHTMTEDKIAEMCDVLRTTMCHS